MMKFYIHVYLLILGLSINVTTAHNLILSKSIETRVLSKISATEEFDLISKKLCWKVKYLQKSNFMVTA